MDLSESSNGVDPSTHWYYQSKKIPLFRYFEKVSATQTGPMTIVDFGSGSGFFGSALLEAYPERIDGVLLIDTGYTDKDVDVTKDERVKKLREIPQGVQNALLIMMDVLEHIEDEAAVLADIRNKLGPDTHAFITVPAFQSLWSGHDVFLGHYRRYTGRSLARVLRDNGYQIDHGYYVYAGIFPIAWTVRRLKNLRRGSESPRSSDLKPLPAPLNWLLRTYNTLEMGPRKLNRFFGLTCVAEGRLR